MQQSNRYIIIFTLIMTIVVGGLLSLTSQVLGPSQKISIELDTKSQILSAVMDLQPGDDVLAIYRDRIQSLVVDSDGNEVTQNEKGQPIVAEDVSILKNSKRPAAERQLPVFKFMNETNPSQVDAYILPMYGKGLWDNIWGFVAVSSDLESITGVAFDHKQETPGLGARISDKEIQLRYVGKRIYNQQGILVSIEMVKGEQGGGDASIQAFAGEPNKVDGLAGATLTAKGVNKMLKDYLNNYEAYLQKIKSTEAI